MLHLHELLRKAPLGVGTFPRDVVEDKGTVLGLLLEGARRLPVDAKAHQRWKELGDRELAARARQATAPSLSTGDGIPSNTEEKEREREPGEAEGEEHAVAGH